LCFLFQTKVQALLADFAIEPAKPNNRYLGATQRFICLLNLHHREPGAIDIRQRLFG